jgi:hypothetical protein
MGKHDADKSLPEDVSPEQPIETQGREQTGQRQIRVHIDERDLKTSFASGFRPTGTAEEVILDFGLNMLRPSAQQPNQREVIFQANNRIIMTYYAAKRLALALGNIVRRYEQEFGELELNAAKRRIDQSR